MFDGDQAVSKLALALEQREQALGGDRGDDEQRERPRRELGVRDGEQPDDRHVEGDRGGRHRAERLRDVARAPAAEPHRQRGERDVERLGDQGGGDRRDDDAERRRGDERLALRGRQPGDAGGDRPDARVRAPAQIGRAAVRRAPLGREHERELADERCGRDDHRGERAEDRGGEHRRDQRRRGLDALRDSDAAALGERCGDCKAGDRPDVAKAAAVGDYERQ